MSTDKERAEFVQGLRELAAFVERTQCDVPAYHSVNVFVTPDEYRRHARLASWRKYYMSDSYAVLRKAFVADVDFPPVSLDVTTERSGVCRRVVVETRAVPEQIIPAHDEDVIEWVCGESLLDGRPEVRRVR